MKEEKNVNEADAKKKIKQEHKTATKIVKLDKAKTQKLSPESPDENVRRSSRSTKGVNKKYGEPLVKTEMVEEEMEDDDDDYVPSYVPEIIDDEDDFASDTEKPKTKSSPKKKGTRGNVCRTLTPLTLIFEQLSFETILKVYLHQVKAR